MVASAIGFANSLEAIIILCLFVCLLLAFQMESTLIQLEQVLLASKRSLKSGLLYVAAGKMYTSFCMVWSEDAHE